MTERRAAYLLEYRNRPDVKERHRKKEKERRLRFPDRYKEWTKEYRSRHPDRKKRRDIVDNAYKAHKKKRYYLSNWIDRYLESVCQKWGDKRIMALIRIKNTRCNSGLKW